MIVAAHRSRFSPRLTEPLPGIGLCLAVSLAAYAGQQWELRVFGQPYLEALVLAILIGVAVRTAWTPSAVWHCGIEISARLLLEIAVALLGASVTLQTVAAAGPMLLAAIAGIVVLSLAGSYGLSRLLGLPPKMAVLIAAGNSICGNSAIAAVAPVIGAAAADVAAAIAFTAVLGVVVVLALPALPRLLTYSPYSYGVLAGLTVYAVPQVLAATIPVSAISAHVGTLVKLVRVLMLGPVVLSLSLIFGRRGALPVHKMVPWFIVGFLLLATMRSCGLVPDGVRLPIAQLASLLTVVSMAALGLGVDLRVLRRVGARATAAVTLSLLLLFGLSIGAIALLGVP